MNLSDLKRAAQHADAVQGNSRTRLTEVHLRIRTARRRRTVAVAGALAVAIGLSGAAVNGARQAAQVRSPAGTSTASPSVIDTEPSWCTTSTTAPPAGRVGYIGLPPAGATPSTTTGAPLVFEWFGADRAGVGKSEVWLFAVGRLIVEREAFLTQGANERQTGYLERCLSPAGVERMHNFLLEVGVLLTADPPYPAWLRVRGNQDMPLIDFDPLAIDEQRLLAPESWLYESDWIDKPYRPHVPKTYSFCSTAAATATAPSPVLDQLPRRAVDVLANRPWQIWDLPTPSVTCTTVTPGEARVLVGIFDDAWFGPDYVGPPARLDVGLSTRETPNVTEANRSGALFVTIEPVLPDGQFTCNCG